MELCSLGRVEEREERERRGVSWIWNGAGGSTEDSAKVPTPVFVK